MLVQRYVCTSQGDAQAVRLGLSVANQVYEHLLALLLARPSVRKQDRLHFFKIQAPATDPCCLGHTQRQDDLVGPSVVLGLSPQTHAKYNTSVMLSFNAETEDQRAQVVLPDSCFAPVLRWDRSLGEQSLDCIARRILVDFERQFDFIVCPTKQRLEGRRLHANLLNVHSLNPLGQPFADRFQRRLWVNRLAQENLHEFAVRCDVLRQRRRHRDLGSLALPFGI